MNEKIRKKLTSIRKYFIKINVLGTIKNGVKISLKLFTLNVDKELFIQILEGKLPKMRKYSNWDS